MEVWEKEHKPLDECFHSFFKILKLSALNLPSPMINVDGCPVVSCVEQHPIGTDKGKNQDGREEDVESIKYLIYWQILQKLLKLPVFLRNSEPKLGNVLCKVLC